MCARIWCVLPLCRTILTRTTSPGVSSAAYSVTIFSYPAAGAGETFTRAARLSFFRYAVQTASGTENG